MRERWREMDRDGGWGVEERGEERRVRLGGMFAIRVRFVLRAISDVKVLGSSRYEVLASSRYGVQM